MWNRWYNPALGRFVSRDPIGLKGGLNLYEYVDNNPFGGVDVKNVWRKGPRSKDFVLLMSRKKELKLGVFQCTFDRKM
jgi:hypothetical protein